MGDGEGEAERLALERDPEIVAGGTLPLRLELELRAGDRDLELVALREIDGTVRHGELQSAHVEHGGVAGTGVEHEGVVDHGPVRTDQLERAAFGHRRRADEAVEARRGVAGRRERRDGAVAGVRALGGRRDHAVAVEDAHGHVQRGLNGRAHRRVDLVERRVLQDDEGLASDAGDPHAVRPVGRARAGHDDFALGRDAARMIGEREKRDGNRTHAIAGDGVELAVDQVCGRPEADGPAYLGRAEAGELVGVVDDVRIALCDHQDALREEVRAAASARLVARLDPDNAGDGGFVDGHGVSPGFVFRGWWRSQLRNR